MSATEERSDRHRPWREGKGGLISSILGDRCHAIGHGEQTSTVCGLAIDRYKVVVYQLLGRPFPHPAYEVCTDCLNNIEPTV